MKHWFVKKIKLRIGIFTSGSKLTINRSVIVYDLRLKKCDFFLFCIEKKTIFIYTNKITQKCN